MTGAGGLARVWAWGGRFFGDGVGGGAGHGLHGFEHGGDSAAALMEREAASRYAHSLRSQAGPREAVKRCKLVLSGRRARFVSGPRSQTAVTRRVVDDDMAISRYDDFKI